MTTVFTSIRIDAPADKVWAMVSQFCNVNRYHDAVVSSVAEAGGLNRRLRFAEPGKIDLDLSRGGEIVERLTRLDDHGRSLSYRIVEEKNVRFPFRSYQSNMVVRDDVPGKSCVVEWFSTSVPVEGCSDEDVRHFIAPAYEFGLRQLKAIFEGSGATARGA